MPYVRLSIATPRRGQEQRARDLMKQIADAARGTPGCVASYLLQPTDGSTEVARIAVYDDQAAADKAANLQHFLALHSEFHLVIEAGHIDRAFISI
ncbi:MAG: antibiotic biosynthesis monooxygenase [Dehalococcoidia bacterium]